MGSSQDLSVLMPYGDCVPLDPDFLAQSPFFSAVDPIALKALSRGASVQEHCAGQVVFLEGEESLGLYLVESGWLKGSKLAASGREQVLRYFGAGETVNEAGLFVEVANPATLTALEPARTWLISRRDIRRIVEEQPKLLLPMTQSLALRLLQVVQLVEDLALLPLEARIARFLLAHAEEGVLERKRWETQTELAARLGAVPDVLHRVLRTLSGEGLVDVTRQRILILDLEGLAARAALD